MNKEIEYFFIDDFLDSELSERLIREQNQMPAEETLPSLCGYLINPDGTCEEDVTNPTIYNRYHDNSILKSLLPTSTSETIDLLESKLKEHISNPVVYNFRVITNITMDPTHTSGGWHKDYNPIEKFDDLTKQWITFYTLSGGNVDSEFQVSYTSEWPDVWQRGIREVLSDNRLFGHNMNLGHQYHQNENNDVMMIYIRWYDKPVPDFNRTK